MASKKDAYEKGFKNGSQGKEVGSWGDFIGDALVNESGSGKARLDGYRDGKDARMNRNK